MMILVVAEKPSVAQVISKLLRTTKKEDGYSYNEKYIVSYCVGHLLGLATPETYDDKYKKQPWDNNDLPIIPEIWKLTINENTSSQFKVLKELMQRTDVTELICATDAGREGECIFRYIYYYIRCNKPVKRLWASSLEESALKQAFKNMKSNKEYDNLFYAGYARARADWLVGINASRLFSTTFKAQLSVGRVQTPTLALIVDREDKIKNFKKEKYFTVDLDCKDFIASSKRIDNEQLADTIVKECDGNQAVITNIQKNEKKVNPPKLFDLTSLQREANKCFGYTAQETLNYTQSLYEKRLVTYPRTDSQYITDDMEQTAYEVIGVVCSYLPELSKYIYNPNVQRCINNNKVSDHHAIIPTKNVNDNNANSLSNAEKNVLFLISTRLLLAVSESHRYEETKIDVICNNHTFTAIGRNVTFEGFKVLEDIIKQHLKPKKTKSKKDADKDEIPFRIPSSNTIYNVKAYKSEHYTSPPTRYTDASLLRAMEIAGNNEYKEDSDIEKKGLGTPATRSGIIETLVTRNYIKRDKTSLIPTEKGINLISIVPAEVKSPKMTSDWEYYLQKIEKGLGSPQRFMQSIINYVNWMVENFSNIQVEQTQTQNLNFKYDSIGVCPKCGKKVMSFSKSYSCESGKDGCGFVIWKEIAGKKITEKQARRIIEKGKSTLLKGFKSTKTNNKFEAYLKLNPDTYKIEFEFSKKRNQ